MKKFVFSLLVLASVTLAQDIVNPLASSDPAAANETDTTPVGPPAPVKPIMTEFPTQCFYDYARNRVNHDCNVSKMPPTCQRGNLVQTKNGEEYEMCCCNFSNFEPEKPVPA